MHAHTHAPPPPPPPPDTNSSFNSPDSCIAENTHTLPPPPPPQHTHMTVVLLKTHTHTHTQTETPTHLTPTTESISETAQTVVVMRAKPLAVWLQELWRDDMLSQVGSQRQTPIPSDGYFRAVRICVLGVSLSLHLFCHLRHRQKLQKISPTPSHQLTFSEKPNTFWGAHHYHPHTMQANTNKEQGSQCQWLICIVCCTALKNTASHIKEGRL